MECTGVLIGHEGPVLVTRFTANGNYCMTGSSDRSVRLWAPQRNVCIQTYTGPHNYDVFDLDIAADNSRFVSGGGDKLVFIWDVQTAKAIRRFTGHAQRVKAVAWGAEATVVFSGSEDGTVKAWDCRSGDKEAIQTMREARDSVSCVKAKDNCVVASSLDGCLRTYDLRRGALTSDEMRQPIHCFSLSKHDNCVLTSHQNSQLCVLDLHTGVVLSHYQGKHKAGEYRLSCTLSIDSKRAFVGSEGRTVVGYSLVGEQEVIGEGHVDPVVAVDMHPRDATVVISGSLDTTARIWRIPSKSPTQLHTDSIIDSA